MLQTSQQLRTAYLQECYTAQRELTSIEFIQALAAKNIHISIMTATLVSGCYNALEVEATQEKELVAA